MNLKELQKVQKKFDEEFLTYPNNQNEIEKIRHLTLHLGKLLGKISTFCEASEHNRHTNKNQIKNEVMPDLLFYSLQLANLYHLDLEKYYIKRLEEDKKRIKNG